VILDQSRQRRKAIGGKVKRTTRTTIIVETHEVWLVRGEWRQGRCARCGEPGELTRDRDAAENLDVAEAGQPRPTKPDRRRLTCLRSLLKWFQ
jgi:hypothetical protein